MRRGFKADANRIAVKVRAGLGLGPACPIDPWTVCVHFEIDVWPLSELADPSGGQVGHHFLHVDTESFSAVTVHHASRRVIVHNDSHHHVRQRSNLTHELAHCFLGHALTGAFKPDGNRDRNPLIEEEAAFLGGSLLITNEAAHRIVASGNLDAARSAYGVSRQMLEFRLRMSGAHTVAGRRKQSGSRA